MIYLCYEKNDTNDDVALFELNNGIKKLVRYFIDRETMLAYIEINYNYANLIIMR